MLTPKQSYSDKTLTPKGLRLLNSLETSLTNPLRSFKRFRATSARQKLNVLLESLILPLLAIVIFLGLWSLAARTVVTSLGNLPGPVQVAQQGYSLFVLEPAAQQVKAAEFYERQDARNAEALAEDPNATVRNRPFNGKPSFLSQIGRSLQTVFTGFLLASLIAVPLGIVCGLSQKMYSALNPLIQVLKPISPLAWLPIITIVVSAVYVTDNPALDKAFITSAITVTLCSLWPTLINTVAGVSSIDKNLLNVSRVLQLNKLTEVFKITIPAALPMIFTGLRISLGIGWMVLIAAEMLAQNPGLGKFVWDEFQNGSSDSLSRILVAVVVIGLIGFALDRIMMSLQGAFSYDRDAVIR